MTLVADQLRHDRINLGRLVKRLEVLIDGGLLNTSNLLDKEAARGVVEGVAQKLKYARQLLSNIEMSESIDPQSSHLQVMRNTLSRLDEIVELADSMSQAEPPPYDDVDFLSLVSLPPPVVEDIITVNNEQSMLGVGDAILDDPTSPALPSGPSTTQTIPTLSSRNPEALLPSLPPQSQLLPSSLKTHEELSDQLAHMAAQLRRNAEHFSVALEKDKGLVVSAEEALLKNAETMSRERDRLKKHGSKSFGTTWYTLGAILVVCLIWVWMFVIIRVT